MSVARILSGKGRSVVTVQPHRSLAEAAQQLVDRHIGALVVADAERAVIGIISERDIVRAVVSQGGSALDNPVSRHMTTKVVTCTPEADLDEVMETMTEGRFRHVPVVEDGRLVGIISIGDAVKQRIATVEAEHRAMRDYITTA